MANPPSSDRPTVPTRPSHTALERRQLARLSAAALIGALMAAFALVNLNDVKVHWVIATGETPLIVVIALAFLLGIVADRLLLVRAKRRRRTRS